MAITLFQKRNLGGDSAVITGDENDLKDLPIGRNPSSLRMTTQNDAVLLFTKRDWKGNVMYRRGAQVINRLGSPRHGGRNGFGNNVASARITPFHINLNVTVVTQSDGTIPGTDPTFAAVRNRIAAVVQLVNGFFVDQQALLIAHIAHTNQRVHDNKFNLSMIEAARFPASWKNAREIDVIFVNAFDSGTLGLAKKPWWGKTCVVAMRNTGPGGPQRPNGVLAKTLAHEIGHFLGSPHAAGTNIMRQGNFDISTRTATVDQIQEWHTKLSRNLTRRRNRREG